MAAEGIEVRHSRGCRTADGGRCNCSPSYRASVWLAREKKLARKAFRSQAEAKGWLADARAAARKGGLAVPKSVTIRQAAEAWLEGAKAGHVLNRSGDVYKPSAIRQYEHHLRHRVLPAFGDYRVTELRRSDVQEFVDRLVGEGLSASTVQTSVLPLRTIYRRALARGEVAVNPCTGLEVPAIRSQLKRIADPDEAAALLAAIPAAGDRVIWATAFYAGLRLGELRALRWVDLDLASGRLRVERGWDEVEGEISPKSREGRRTVPIAGVLRDVLLEHRMSQPDERHEGMVFGRTATDPFSPERLRERARKAWKAAGLEPIGLHECRHTFASFMIAAGVNAKALSRYMGHFSISITLDLYGHLMPGNEEEAAGMLEAYLTRADTAARLAQI